MVVVIVVAVILSPYAVYVRYTVVPFVRGDASDDDGRCVLGVCVCVYS